MIIQSPELLEYKKLDAENRIDKYLLSLVIYKKGCVFGVKFNERQSKPSQWLLRINSCAVLAGVGDLRDFQSATLAISSFCQNMASILGEHYITGDGIVKYLTGVLHRHFEEKARALAVNFIIADWREKKLSLWFIDFDGSIKQLKNFAVAGGNEYETPLTKEELEKLAPEEKKFLEQKRSRLNLAGVPDTEFMIPVKIHKPRKQAIAYLEKNWKPNMKKEETVELTKKCLFECNPESQDKMIEVIALECNKEPELLYFKKDRKQ